MTAYNRDTGLQLGRIASSTPSSQWPANNLIVSSESHDNADSDGEDADGFAAKLTTGTGNVFRYDVSHHNIDDGWDLYTKTDTGAIGPVTIEYSLSYNNGTLSDGTVNTNGDRNGYKLGGDDIPVNHVVQHSIAYKNGHHGFTYNSNPGTMTISNNLGVDNAERNFVRQGHVGVPQQHLLPLRRQRLQRQNGRQRRQLQPVLDRLQRLPLLLVRGRPRLVLRLRRPPRGDLRRQCGQPVTGAGRFGKSGTPYRTASRSRRSQQWEPVWVSRPSRHGRLL